jgi:hypothetical protein
MPECTLRVRGRRVTFLAITLVGAAACGEAATHEMTAPEGQEIAKGRDKKPDAGTTDAGGTDGAAKDGGATDSGATDGQSEACTPTTCAASGKNCGTLDDGCGHALACGSCASPQSCGGGGVANVCGGGSSSTVTLANATSIVQMVPATTDFVHETASSVAPRMVWAGTRWVTFWGRVSRTCVWPNATTDFPTCTTNATELVATETDANGNVLSPPHTIAPLPAGAGEFAVLATPSGFVTAWWASVPAGGGQLTVTTIDGSFAVTHQSQTATQGFTANVQLAGDGTTNAVVFDIQNPHQFVYFARVNADASLGAQVNVPSPAFDHQVSGALAWDGTSFGWVFENDALALMECLCDTSGNGSDVQVEITRLSPTGATLGTTMLSEGTEVGMEDYTRLVVQRRPTGGFWVAWATSIGGRDIVLADVAADGTKEGTNHHVTNDGDTTFEDNPSLSASPSGSVLFAGYAFQSIKGTTSELTSGVRVVPLDVTGNPNGGVVEALPQKPGCFGIEYIGSRWFLTPENYYPTEALPWCTGPGLGPDTQSLVLAASGANALEVMWPAQVFYMMANPLTPTPPYYGATEGDTRYFARHYTY